MEREILKIRYSIVLACACTLISSCMERKQYHRNIDKNSIIIKQTTLSSIFAKKIDSPHGSAWKISGVEYGYFFSNLNEEDFAASIYSISKLLGAPLKIESDKKYIETRWAAIYKQFENRSLPFIMDEEAKVDTYEWNEVNYEIQVFRIKSKSNPPMIYVTWREGK